MPPVSEEEAIEIARTALREGPLAAAVWKVRRLDRPGEAYYLVVLGEAGAETGIAAVDEGSGAVRTSARLRGTSSITVSERRARELAGSDAQATASMVWQPCRASLSPLYPLWEVRTPSSLVYVDQEGRLHTRLAPAQA